jgi:hypothetical protein
MNRGFVILASSTEQQRQAAACAYSIRARNPEAKVSMLIPKLDHLVEEYRQAFTDVHALKFRTNNKMHIRAQDWQLYWSTPYEYTIALDCRTLVNTNFDTIWEYLIDHHDVCFPTQVCDFRLQPIQTHYLDDAFAEHEMQRVYTSMFYFRKSDTALVYFKFLDPCCQNWEQLVSSTLGRHLADSDSGEFDVNLVHSFCIHRLDMTARVTAIHPEILEYVDMDIRNLRIFLHRLERWTSYLTVWPSLQGNVKIQNYVMGDVFNYMESEFLTEEIFDAQRKYALRSIASS